MGYRRSKALRARSVLAMKASIVNRRFLKLTLTTQAGTYVHRSLFFQHTGRQTHAPGQPCWSCRYVKEFVHGDLGRTRPNVGSLLGCTADILQLDVEEVHVDWPPPATEPGTQPAAPYCTTARTPV